MSEAIDAHPLAPLECAMEHVSFEWDWTSPKFVGSLGNLADLRVTRLENIEQSCDLVEIRLDSLYAQSGKIDPSDWAHLAGFPKLFTARRSEEGGVGHLDASTRATLLLDILNDASFIDIEVASISEMPVLLTAIRERKIPWIASFHDFAKLPETSILEQAEAAAQQAGATIFKVAVMLSNTSDLARLADFQMKSHLLPVSTMGMGPMAPVSRLLNTQSGSVLNYGYLGNEPTAPGQWDCALLKNTASRLMPLKN